MQIRIRPQNLFNHHIFVMEQAQYAAEGVDVSAIEFINNKPCVDLIENKQNGILSLLNDICTLGQATTDARFKEVLDTQHNGKNPYARAHTHIHFLYGRPFDICVTSMRHGHACRYYGTEKKRSLDKFSIAHFAGAVSYCVDGFITKNNDTLCGGARAGGWGCAFAVQCVTRPLL